MNAIYNFCKTTIIGGVVALVPIAVVIYIVVFALDVSYKITTPILKWLGIESTWTIALAPIGAVGALLALCFVLGIAVQTSLGRWFGHWFERLLLQHLPGYEFLKRLSRSVAGKDSDGLGAPVMLRWGNIRQMGFLMEELPNNQATVFVPLAPAMTLGSVVVADCADLERLNVPVTEVFNAVGTLGYGTGKVIGPQI
jgi:uncharacterized membrane protein